MIILKWAKNKILGNDWLLVLNRIRRGLLCPSQKYCNLIISHRYHDS